MRLMTLCPLGQPRSSAEIVVWALAKQPVMTLRQLRSIISRSRDISHQAVWKLLRGLMEDGVVSKVADRRYSLNRQWIRDLRRFCAIAELNQQAFEIDEEVRECKK